MGVSHSWRLNYLRDLCAGALRLGAAAAGGWPRHGLIVVGTPMAGPNRRSGRGCGDRAGSFEVIGNGGEANLGGGLGKTPPSQAKQAAAAFPSAADPFDAGPPLLTHPPLHHPPPPRAQ